MITLTLDTWVSVGGFAAATITVLLGVFAQGRSTRTELKADLQRVESNLGGEIDRVESNLRGEIDRVESNLRGEIDRVESNLRGEIDRVESNLKAEINRVDDRVYALAAGLKPDIERAGEQRRGA